MHGLQKTIELADDSIVNDGRTSTVEVMKNIENDDTDDSSHLKPM